MSGEMIRINGSFPRAIVHIDGDAFFTSVEQAMHPHLKGKPVVSGKERGIIACASYEAKALGIKRGVGLWEAKKICPTLIVLPSDYESYSLYSKRMFEIMRRFTPTVEEYSIDEGFADLTGLRRVHRMSYEQIARKMQETIHQELDLTVSVGLSLSKGLCKIASDFRKPHGFTAVRGRHITPFLQRVALPDIWGIGPNSVELLHKYGLKTAYDFTEQPEKWVRKLLGKPGVEIWHELRGKSLLPVNPEPKRAYHSIGKGKTFSSPSNDRAFVYAQLVRNTESAFIKLRRHQHRCGELFIALRYRDYQQRSLGVRLNRTTDSTQEILPIVHTLFDQLFASGVHYRATQIWLNRLEHAERRQLGLFENQLRIARYERLSRTVDQVNARFGKHCVRSAATLPLQREKPHARTELPWRKLAALDGETARQRLYLPRLNIIV